MAISMAVGALSVGALVTGCGAVAAKTHNAHNTATPASSHSTAAQGAPDLSKLGITLSAPTDSSPPVTAAAAISVARQQVGGTVTGASLKHCQNAALTPPMDVDCWVVSEQPGSAGFSAIVGAGVGGQPPAASASPTLSVVLVDAHTGAFMLAASA